MRGEGRGKESEEDRERTLLTCEQCERRREERRKERKISEGLKGLVLKTRDRKGSVGSNPTFPEEKKRRERANSC